MNTAKLKEVDEKMDKIDWAVGILEELKNDVIKLYNESAKGPETLMGIKMNISAESPEAMLIGIGILRAYDKILDAKIKLLWQKRDLIDERKKAIMED